MAVKGLSKLVTEAHKQTVTNFDPDQINDYFADIATDPNYNRDQAQQAPNHPLITVRTV